MFKQALTLLLLLISAGSYLSAQVNLFNTPPEFVAPCGPAYTYQIELVNESGTVIQNAALVYEFPNGVQYVQGSINGPGSGELDISNAGIPVFRIATLAEGLTRFELQATVDCQPGDGSAQLRDSLTLRYDQIEAGFSGTTYNVNNPILTVAGTNNLNAIANINSTIQRELNIVNSGFREVTELIITDEIPNSIALESINIGTITNTNPIQIVISGDDFTGIGNGDTLFDPNEQLLFQETIRLLDCNDGESTLTVSSGCDGEICQTFSTLQANVRLENSFPQLEWTILQEEYAGICSEGFIEVAIFNAGNEITAGAGTAFNILLNPGIGVNSTSPSVDSCMLLENFSIGNQPFLNPINGDQYLLALNQLNADPDGPGGLEDLDGDGQFDDLAIGDSLRLRFNLQFSADCIDDICGSLINRVFRMRLQSTSQCQGEVVETTTTFNTHIYDIDHSVIFDNLATQYGNGEEFEVDFIFNGRMRGFDNNCAEDSAVIHLVLPPSIALAANFNPLFSGNPINYTTSGDTLNLIVGSRSGTLRLNFQVLCEPPPGIDPDAQCGGVNWSPEQIARFEVWMTYYCEPQNCATPIQLYCSSSSQFIVSCPSLSNVSGLFSKQLDIRRKTLGWTDESLSQKVDPNSPDLELQTAMTHDLVQFDYVSVALGSGSYDTSVIQFMYEYPDSLELLRYITDTLIFYDAETNQSISCNNIGFDQVSYQQGTFVSTFSILDLLSPGSCLEGLHLTGGDSLIFKVVYQVSADAPETPVILPGLGIAHHYTTDGVDYNCGFAGGILKIFNPTYRFTSSSSFLGSACDPIHYNITLVQGNQPIGFPDHFPFEYRPIVFWDSVRVKLPDWTAYIPGSSRFNYEYRANNVQLGSILRDTIGINDPMLQQIGEDNWLIFPDEKSFVVTDLLKASTISNLSFEIQPTCLADTTSDIAMDIFYRSPFYAEDSVETQVANRQIPFDLSVNGFTLNPIDPLSLGLEDTLSWSFQLCNGNSNIAVLPYTLLHLAFPNDDIIPFQVVETLPNSQTVIYPVEAFGNDYMVKIDSLDRLSCRLFELQATFSSCEQISFDVFAYHYCDAYPTSIAELVSECNDNTPSMQLTLDPQAANLQVNLISSPPSPIQLCDSLAYELKVLNAGIGTALELSVMLELPQLGLSLLDGVSEYRIGNGPYEPLQDPVQIPGTNRFVWELNNQNLSGLNEIPLNELYIRFQLETDCEFQNLSTFSYVVSWEDICGSISRTTPLFSLPFELEGAPQELNIFELSASLDTLNACVPENRISFQLINQGGSPNDSTSTEERIRVELPDDVQFVAGSFQNLINFPGGGNPADFVIDSIRILEWPMPLGLGIGDTIAFSLAIEIQNPGLLDCGLLPITLKTLEIYSITCVTMPGNPCNIAFPSAIAPFSFPLEMPQITLNLLNLAAIPAPPLGENFLFDLEITNTSDYDGSGPLAINYHYDIDGNGQFDDSIDSFAGTDFIDAGQLVANTTQVVPSSLFIPADSTCYGMLVTINQQADQCLCNDAEAFTPNVPIFSANPDTAVCEGDPITIGNPPIPGYSYEWTPTDFLQNPAVATTVFENLIPLGTEVFNRADTLYLLTTRSQGCASLDTMIIQSIRIESELVIDQIISCAGSGDGALSLAVNGGLAPLNYNWSPFNDTTPTLTQLSGGTYAVTITDRIGCQSQAAIELTEPLPLELELMSFDLDCNGTNEGEILIETAGGTLPYVYLWSNGDTSANLLDVGAGTYQLLFTDANGCVLLDSATIQEPPPIPTDFALDDATCFEDQDGSISILEPLGADYLYNIDNQPYQSQPLFDALARGEYLIGIRDPEGCTTSELITIGSGPEILINAPADTTIRLGDSVLLVAIPDLSVASDINWSPANTLSCTLCFDPTASPLQTTTYTITVVNEDGCIDEDEVTVFVDADYEVFFPNIFTPNQDGINDRFTAYGNDQIRIIRELRLFDRWGEEVFSRSNFNPNDESIGWDGNFKGEQMNNAVFVFYARVEFIDGKVKLFEGDVTLVK